MPLQATSGAASYDAFGGGVPVVPTYIEDVFSSYLWTGNDSTQTITNGIDLAGKGGLVWMKGRSEVGNHYLATTNGGNTSYLNSDTTNAYQTSVTRITSFNANGFSLGGSGSVNGAGATYVSWTFRKQPKFFDVVTWTGDGSGSRVVSHALASQPGFIIIKSTSAVTAWTVAASDGSGNYKLLDLNTTAAAMDTSTQSLVASSSGINVGWISSNWAGVNGNGVTYVAYLFAHNAGGFGLTGTDNVISCGSFTASMGSLVNIGFEPQFVLIKRTDTSSVDDWLLFDNMRGLTMGDDSLLNPNTSGAENNSLGNNYINPQPTGFTQIGFGSGTYIYIAIRRGPMKVPTSGTSVYNGIARTGTGAATNITGAGFPIDLLIQHERATSNNIWTTDRLRGTLSNLDTQSTAAENTNSFFQFDKQDGFGLVGAGANVSGRTMIDWVFRRTPSVFDVVCYTGNSTARTINHNLAAVPELMIVKTRSTATDWAVYIASKGNQWVSYLNSSYQGDSGQTVWNSTNPTSSVFSLGTDTIANADTRTYVAYLFATCAGVSKVGSYTGTATTKQIDCGFTGGARFVLIKRTDSTGDWYVWDTARGIVSGNDPYLLLNSAAVEVTSTDYIDTYSAGFEISSTAPAAINASGGTYIFLAIA